MTDKNAVKPLVNDAFPKLDQFSDRVEYLTRKFGSASEVARLAGTSDTVVRKWMKGESDPSRERCIALAAGTGTPLLWLMTGEAGVQPMSQPARIDAEILSRAVYVLNGVLAQIDSHMDHLAYAETLLMLVDYLREHEGKLEPNNVVDLMEFIKRRQNNGRGRPDS